jgi:Glucodextranase, domain B/FecR protein
MRASYSSAMLRAAVCLALLLAVPACKRDGTASLSVGAAGSGGDSSAQAVVTAKQGKVQLLRASDGTVAEAKVGDRLSSRDALRTEVGEADVAVDGVRVRLHESSRLELKHVGDQALRARVRGSVESEVEDKGKLDVEIENSDATAHSDGGHFFVTADGRGVVAVASVTGTVNVAGGGRSVALNQGEVTRLTRSSPAPSKPVAALRRVLLSVQWPDQKETNKATLPIEGRVDPGSRVFIQGQPVAVEESGTFHAEVPLRKGKQKIAVVTVDALGRRKEVEGVVLRDDSLPDAKVKKGLWQWRRR